MAGSGADEPGGVGANAAFVTRTLSQVVDHRDCTLTFEEANVAKFQNRFYRALTQ